MQQNYHSNLWQKKTKNIYFLIFGKLSLKSTTQAHMTAHCEDNANKINKTSPCLWTTLCRSERVQAPHGGERVHLLHVSLIYPPDLKSTLIFLG